MCIRKILKKFLKIFHDYEMISKRYKINSNYIYKFGEGYCHETIVLAYIIYECSACKKRKIKNVYYLKKISTYGYNCQDIIDQLENEGFTRVYI